MHWLRRPFHGGELPLHGVTLSDESLELSFRKRRRTWFALGTSGGRVGESMLVP